MRVFVVSLDENTAPFQHALWACCDWYQAMEIRFVGRGATNLCLWLIQSGFRFFQARSIGSLHN